MKNKYLILSLNDQGETVAREVSLTNTALANMIVQFGHQIVKIFSIEKSNVIAMPKVSMALMNQLHNLNVKVKIV